MQSEHETLWVCTRLRGCPCVWEHKPFTAAPWGLPGSKQSSLHQMVSAASWRSSPPDSWIKSRLQLGFTLTLVQSTRASADVTDCAQHEVLQQLRAVESASSSSVIRHCCALCQCCFQLIQDIFTLVHMLHHSPLQSPTLIWGTVPGVG